MPNTKERVGIASGLIFGTAGIPHSTPSPQTSHSGITRIRELGLGCMEVEFVQGVNMGEKTASILGAVARNRGARLTAHCPYYINLNSPEEVKITQSIERILQTARVTSAFGGDGVVFHPAFYLKQSPDKVYDMVKKHLTAIVEQLEKEKRKVWVRPEVMGRATQFGTLNEVLRLSAEVEGVAPCLDFAHLHSRAGNFNSYKEFSQALDQVGEKLGRAGLENLHLHISGIEYGDKGERKHVDLGESDFQYVELLQALKDHEAKGLVICESPNLETDALLLKSTYETL